MKSAFISEQNDRLHDLIGYFLIKKSFIKKIQHPWNLQKGEKPWNHWELSYNHSFFGFFTLMDGGIQF